MSQQRRAMGVAYRAAMALLLVHVADLLDQQVAALKSLEQQMADLNQSVADLEASVDAIAGRFATANAELLEALAAANEALANEELDDAATQAALDQSLADADAAAQAIDAQVQELNSIGASPETPVEPGPIEETPPAEEPPVEEQPQQ